MANRSSRGALTGAVIGAAVGAIAARAAYAAFRRRPPIGGAKDWSRTNHRGEQVTLLEGTALVTGAGAAAVITPGLSLRHRAAALLTAAGAGLFGTYDDLYGTTSSKGFKGHLAALARGEITSGAVKIAGIGATGLAAAALAAPAKGVGGALGVLADGALIAGSANLANLFDLRPGRAIKVGLLAGVPLLAASAGSRGGRSAAALAAVPLGAAAALLPEDLGERAMLGDGGANALGALLGLAAVTRLNRPARLAALGVVAALTAASEKVSFTKVIAANPVLNWLDMLGRRPPQPQAVPPAAAKAGQAAPAGKASAEQV
ncbi:hypothetical protein TBS_10190 [Thermobispora bispora]|uniref:Glycosyl transferase family 4 n=1 Tax=Thermobispora bispora (strain ATCC 19993 / DSM 43833 / CBS 139.67 / JCM 10125 / KCTC 9307 / NBRC 14880 / R51) TaxID=469371 RepID=D6Y1W4_THEBD|nr:hypothetical protein Tbis_2008 [Thermobispora bispora DSM 43833]MBO2474544.1 hypothetical protein [Actinomycetales bacterium]MBX6167400.1 hypothetical protein [Thermobispora bispora]QSI48495.1 hypothetical protein CYL17_12005 [Thermobispora bispora]